MVRTRFAPSPTGYMHIGNLRTALYAYLVARHHQGSFILRIEDTDRKRNIPKAVQVIYDSLELAGLDYDEGPLKDGGYGPYVQSLRKEQGIYQQHAEILIERGGAYRCFCMKEGSETGKSGRIRRDPCRYLSTDEIANHLEEGHPFVVRQRIPEEGTTTFTDLVFGEITIKNSTLEDQILLKSDGYPTYNFANVIDDHLMGITHVARGVEYLSSTPKYNLLYAGFGWKIPAYIHLPHIVKESGKKLSKRAGDASFQDLLAKGYLPEAIVNYIALLGWSPGNDQEVFNLEQLVEVFDVHHINKSKAAFSIQKLEWLNGEHIRLLTVDDFHQRAVPFYPNEISTVCDTALISKMIQSRVTKLSDIPEMIAFLGRVPEYTIGLYDHAKSKSTLESSLTVLRYSTQLFENLPEWNEEIIRETLISYANSTGLKTGTVMWPIRIALSGLQSTPGGAIEIAAILGKDETLSRITQAIYLLEQTIN